jgi:hypothetical protein
MRNIANVSLHQILKVMLRKVRWEDNIARMGQTRKAKANKITIGKPKGTRPGGRRSRWKHSFKVAC